MRAMVSGGGTGGHTSPAVAVIEELRNRSPDVRLEWVGRRGGIEERVSASLSVPFHGLPVEGWPRTSLLRKVPVAVKLVWSALVCRGHLKRFRPDVVFGVGGYVSLPLLWTAQRLGIPTVLHEQNRLLGMANRMLAPKATRVFLSFPDTVGRYPADRAMVVGNPVRKAFADPPDPIKARRLLGLVERVPIVLLCGGSQGARTLNQAVAGALPGFERDEVQVIWMTGAAGIEEGRRVAESVPVRVLVYPFIDDMASACAAADLVVSRSGASSTAELALMGKPSILVPYPHATDNHQEQNARAFEEIGAAILLLDRDCTPETLLRTVRELLADRPRLEAMGAAAKTLGKPDAAKTIAEALVALASE